MVLGRYSKFVVLIFAALSPHSASFADADVVVSKQLGFRFSVPDGFVERTDDQPMMLNDGTPMTVALFTKDVQVDDFPITICIQRLGQIVDPNQRLDLASLPKQDVIRLSIESRRWQKTELPAVRQEATLGPGIDILGYLIQFPLKDEAVQIRVQGPRSRSAEVLKAFNMSVEGFLNTKPYIVKVSPTGTSSNSSHLSLGLLTTCILGLLFVWGVRQFRGTQPTRPLGIVIIGVLTLCTGAFIAGQHLQTLIEVYSDSDGPVRMSNAFAANLIGDLFFSLIAIIGFVGLIVGSKWGWWMSTSYWTWRICNQVLLPFVISFNTVQTVNLDGSSVTTYSELLTGLIVIGLMLAYLYKNSVLDFFRLKQSIRSYLAIGISGSMFVLSGLFHLLKTSLIS